jgi:8-oxo-dGTP pyrophosphatase MutT (NUDIX family)
VQLVGAKVIVWAEERLVLVIRRSETDPREPLTWDLPGGVVDRGEDPGDGAMREVLEETGISLDKSPMMPPTMNENKSSEPER